MPEIEPDVMWLIASDEIFLFASKEVHSDLYKAKEATYKSLFKVVGEIYYCALPLKTCSEGAFWVITDDNNSARFFIRGNADEVKCEMGKYISRFGKPQGAFVGCGYIHHYYDYDCGNVTGSRMTARKILEM